MISRRELRRFTATAKLRGLSRSAESLAARVQSAEEEDFVSWKNVGKVAPPLLLLLLAFFLAIPTQAQVDLSGYWSWGGDEDRDHWDPVQGDFAGLPVNDASRMRSLTWKPGVLELPEVRCQPHPSDYGWHSPYGYHIWPEIDQTTQRVTAWHTFSQYMEAHQIIYMDNRPEPPDYAPHTWQGFSKGKWEGGMLHYTTTHLKEGWLNLVHIPVSDERTISTYIIRHGDNMVVVTVTYDPIYLEAPLIRTQGLVYDPQMQIIPFVCEPANTLGYAQGVIPNYLPGEIPGVNDYPAKYGIPLDAYKGGTETMYPEFRLKMAKMPKLPPPAPAPKSGGN